MSLNFCIHALFLSATDVHSIGRRLPVRRIWGLLLLGVFFLSLIPGHAATFYTYHDQEGNVVVSSSLKSIPEKFRETAEIHEIKEFSPAVPSVVEKDLILEPQIPEPISLTEAQETKTEDATNTALLLASFTPEFASAALLLERLSNLQTKGEMIWALSKAAPLTDRRIRYLHLEGLQIIVSLAPLKTLSWPKHQAWVDKAKILSENYQTLYWTLTHWFDKPPANLSDSLVPLLNRTKFLLLEIRGEFQKISPQESSSR